MHDARTFRSVGTGLVCFGLLVYEVFSVRLLSVIVDGPMAIFAIAFAMLGMGAATSIMSLTNRPSPGTDQDALLGRLAAVLGLAYPLCLMLIAAVSEQTNTALEAAISAGGFNGLVGAIRDNFLGRMVWFGTILFVPYFLFGIFIAALFRSARQADYHALYAADLIGASLGCIVFVVVLDIFGYRGGLVAIIVPTFLGAATFARLHRARSAVIPAALAGATCIAVAFPSIVSLFEPQPALSQLARNYNQEFEVEQTWHVWNAHSRVAHLTMTERESGYSAHVYAHESGIGWAIVPRSAAQLSRTPDSALRGLHAPGQWSRLAAVFRPKRVLVLFAGVGSDMANIYDECGGTCEIVGVEINGHMVEHALSGAAPGVSELLSRPGVRLVTAEAREFLGRDRSRYDAILLSWWGAGTSHYLGTSGQLAQYLYTTEAFETLIEHLTPQGIIVLFNGNKAQTLVNLREVYRKRNWGTLDGKVAILAPAETVGAGFMELIDSKRMVLKPSGFREEELDRLERMANGIGFETIYAPDDVNPDYRIYADIVGGKSLRDLNADLIKEFNTELSIVSDERPFFEHFIPNSYYTDISNWLRSDIDSPQWKFVQMYLFFVVFLAVAAFTIVIAPLLLKSGPAVNARNAMNLCYFVSLGAGFILIEIALVRKFGLILGHPSYAIAIVLAALIFSTGLGSLYTQRLFALAAVDEKRVALAVVLYALIGGAAYDQILETVIALPIPVKAGLVILALFPLGFLMGQLFPQGLMRVSRDDVRLVPWAWAVNATASTVGVGFADLVSRPLGYNAVLYLGAAFYAGILLLPLHARQRSLVPA